jgi:hypothetical protein
MDQQRAHLANFPAAWYFARRLKALKGHTRYDDIWKIRTSEQDGFILDPIHRMPGQNT